MDMYDRIEYQLKNAGMSRRQLAKDVGVPITTLNSAFKRKSKSLSIDMLGDISNALNVPINFLIGKQPFENLEFILENKDYILKCIFQSEFFQLIAPLNFSNIEIIDNSYFALIDMFIGSISITDDGVVLLYKNAFAKVKHGSFNLSEHMKNSPSTPTPFNVIHEIMRPIISEDESSLLTAYRNLPEEGKEYVRNTIKLLREAHKQDGDI